MLVVPYDDDDLERLLLGRSPQFRSLLDRSRQSIKAGKGLSEKAFWEAVGKRATKPKPVAKTRRASRSKRAHATDPPRNRRDGRVCPRRTAARERLY